MDEIGGQNKVVLVGGLMCLRSAGPSGLRILGSLGRLGFWSADASGASAWPEPAGCWLLVADGCWLAGC